MANKTLLVAKREYVENIRTKTFWIGIFIVPVLTAAAMGVGVLLQKFKEVQRYAVVDLGEGDLAARAEREFRAKDVKAMFELGADLMEAAAAEDADPALKELLGGLEPGAKPSGEQMFAMFEWLQSQPPEKAARYEGIGASARYEHVSLADLGLADQTAAEQQLALGKLVADDELFAFFVLGEDPLRDLDDFRYVSNNLTDTGLREDYEDALTVLVQRDRIEDAEVDDETARRIQEAVGFKQEKVSETGEAEIVKGEDKANQWAPIGFVYFLWIAIFSIANLLLTNTVEEKSNRIIEVLLSSVSPSQLMHGKIYGIAFTGMTIIGTWVLFAMLASWLAPTLLGEGGGSLSFLIAAISNTGYLTSFVLYFLGGYLLYAAVLVAIGSVCNTLKEAQNLMQPVMTLLMVPLIAMVFITQEPNGSVAKVPASAPIYTPFTMMNRAAGPPETWEYVVTSALLVVTILLTFKADGKVFRVGVLMTGNPPKLKEILGWLWRS